MATQAAVLAGFTTTCLIEIHLPSDINHIIKGLLHITGVVSICSNITCVSLSTITTMWGSSKALRGADGSMDEAVEGRIGFNRLYSDDGDVMMHLNTPRACPRPLIPSNVSTRIPSS